jgi:hypothetical protein
MIDAFPGVNPFLEAQYYWPDFHLTFFNHWQQAIADVLPDPYEARLDDWRNVAPIQRPGSHRGSATAGALLLEPEIMPTVILDEDRETYLKILHREDRKLVTVLELLSPSNKVAPSRRDYLTRRNAILGQDVHLVELDLLVSGRRPPMTRLFPRGDFHAIVSRWEDRPDCRVYSWTVRMPLPLLPIPLRAPDPDVAIDLSAVYRTAFERGRYARSIDERLPLNLAFAEDPGQGPP